MNINPFKKTKLTLEAIAQSNSQTPKDPSRRRFIGGLAAAAGLYAISTLPGCSTSDSPIGTDLTQTFQPYNVSYEGSDGVKAILSNETNLTLFANALMTGGDISGYTVDQVKSDLRTWIDGNASNNEMYYGMNVNDVDNIVTLRFGTNPNTASFAMAIKLSEAGMMVVKELFDPVYARNAMNSVEGKKLDNYIPTKTISFGQYYQNERK